MEIFSQAKFEKFRLLTMACLPGERPLHIPSRQGETNPLDSFSRSSRGIRIQRNICGAGSAYVEWGNGLSTTKLIAVVKGPRQQSALRSTFEVDVSFSFLQFSGDTKSDLANEVASCIKEGTEGCIDLSRYPQCAISVFVKFIQCGANIHSLLSPAILATVIACQEANIDMRDELICVPVAVLGSGVAVANPNSSQCEANPCASIGILANKRQVAFIHLTGTLNEPLPMIDSLLQIAEGALNEVRAVIAASRTQ